MMQSNVIGTEMQRKEEYTVEYLRNLLSYCDGNANINIIVNANGENVTMPITSLLIHQTEDKRELVSFVFDEKDMSNDL